MVLNPVQKKSTVTLQSKSLLLSGPVAGNKVEQKRIEVTDPLLHIYKPHVPVKCQQHNGIWINEITSEGEFLLCHFKILLEFSKPHLNDPFFVPKSRDFPSCMR